MILPGDPITADFTTHGQAGIMDADSLPEGILVRNGTDTEVEVTVANKATGIYSASCDLPGDYVRGDVVEIRIAATVDGVSDAAIVWSGVVGDKTGYSLTQAFPANFADLAIAETTGLVSVDKTGYKLASDGLSLVATWSVNIAGNVSGSVGSVTGGINTSSGTITTLDALDTAQDAQHTTTQGKIDTAKAVVDEILLDTAEIGAAGAGLTNLPWNASWDTEVESKVTDALNTYDPPTRAELTSDTNSILGKLLKYFQLLFRKDAGIATDNATELTAINADGGSGAGSFDNSTDSTEAIRDQGDEAWTGGGGGSAPTVEEIRIEMDANSTKLAAILEDTGTTLPGTLSTLQTSVDDVPTNSEFEARTLWANQYATAADLATVDGIVDAIKAVTDKIDTGLAQDGLVWQFTVNMLENGPAGEGGGGATAEQVWAYGNRTLTSTGKVTVVGPVIDAENIAIVRGDDYLATDGRELSFESTQWPTLTDATVMLTIKNIRTLEALSVTGQVETVSKCSFELTAEQTNELNPRDQHRFDIQATLASESVVTLTRGKAVVLEDFTQD